MFQNILFEDVSGRMFESFISQKRQQRNSSAHNRPSLLHAADVRSPHCIRARNSADASLSATIALHLPGAVARLDETI